MPDIRYVCLSDVHLAADNSVLTPIKPGSIDIDTSQPSPVLSYFVACLRELIARNERPEKPRLILNGDILEMALADTNEAAMVFERFVELIFPPDGEALFDKHLVYIPGNHDHHIWETARETQYVNFISRIPAGAPLKAPWHTTKMVAPDFVPEHFLTNLLRRYPHLRDATVEVVYPNWALFGQNGQKAVIVTHGHYIESIYSLMSTLNTMIFPDRQKPKTVYDVEAENFAWLDFFWSTMGRSGDVGRDIGLVYDKLQDKNQVEKLLGNFATSLVKQTHHWQWVQWLEAKGLSWLLDVTVGNMVTLERHRPDQALSPDAQHGLHWYLEGPSLEQLRIENKQAIPEDITVLFGHTHKPFQQEMQFVGYPQRVSVYNSGGWVVDQLLPTPIYGAAAILLDEHLHATSLRMYNQAASPKDYRVLVEDSSHPGASNPFHERIKSLVQPERDPWRAFSDAVAEAVRIHAQVLQTKINM
ncbi:MAG TPA: metallophosphoesterase [Ktedonobacterales bacterium]|nr:metallophosphoesterase [Ktedonobacterales bacterium]